jgi:prepilin-type N-terminal cleavage/methylation domain-containing protein
MIRDQRGFTLIEVLVTLVIVGLLIALGAQNFSNLQTNAHASHIIGDFQAVATGVYSKMAIDGVLPNAVGWRQVPPELREYLPPDFEFTYRDARYRWRVWNLRQARQRGYIAGLQVRSANPETIRSLVGVYEGRMALIRANQVTLIVI